MKIRFLFSILALSCFLLLMSCGEEKKEDQIQLKDHKTTSAAPASSNTNTETAASATDTAIYANDAPTYDQLNYKIKEMPETSSANIAVQAAGLSELLESDSAYTFFVPSENAFGQLSEEEQVALFAPENKEKLSNMLKYHIAKGKIDAARLSAAIAGGDGSYTFVTMSGGKLTAMKNGDQIVIKDEKGNQATVIRGNVEASNGMIHVIDRILEGK